jgi:hypothetical protein
MEDREVEAFEHYVAIGAIELEGIDEDGEFLYKVSERAQEIAPELWEVHTAMVEEMVMDMLKDDLVEIEYDEDLTATIKVSENGLGYLRNAGYDV